MKAALIYKFAQFNDWPSLADEFSVCVLGSDNLANALNTLRAKVLKEIPVVVRHPLSEQDAITCQVVVLRPANMSSLRQSLMRFNQDPILTVSDAPEAWDKRHDRFFDGQHPLRYQCIRSPGRCTEFKGADAESRARCSLKQCV